MHAQFLIAFHLGMTKKKSVPADMCR